jgi:hypothetical protein
MGTWYEVVFFPPGPGQVTKMRSENCGSRGADTATTMKTRRTSERAGRRRGPGARSDQEAISGQVGGPPREGTVIESVNQCRKTVNRVGKYCDSGQVL